MSESDDEMRCRECGSLFDDPAMRERHEQSAHIAANEAEVDEAVDESFPASDPPAISPVQRTGTPYNEVKEETDATAGV